MITYEDVVPNNAVGRRADARTFVPSLTKLDCPVMIEWRDPSRVDWCRQGGGSLQMRRYRIVGLDCPAGWIRLQGVATPDVPAFTDGPFWVPLADIAMIEEVS